jgi:hypothetical protein
MDQATQAPVATPTIPGNDPAAVYRALRDQGSILREQQQNLQSQRQDLQQEYDQLSSSNPGRPGIEKRIQAMDARIADLDGQLAKSDQAVANAAAVPGATIEPPDPPRSEQVDIDMVVGLSFMTFMVFLLPVTIAYARRIWRRSARAEVTIPPQVAQQIDSLERGMDAIALEVERIGEGQRFVTQALAERGAIGSVGAGAARPVEVHAGERVEQRR